MYAMVAFLVIGCASGHEYTDYAQSIDSSNRSGQSALTAYFNKKSIDNQNIFKALGGSANPAEAQNNQMAIVLYTILSQQNDQEVLKHFVPHYAVKPTTNGDIGLALSNNFLPTLVKWGAGAWLGGQVVNGLQTTSTVLGAGATMAPQNVKGGDINAGASTNYNDSSGSGNIGGNSESPSPEIGDGNEIIGPVGGDDLAPEETLDIDVEANL